MKKSIVALLVLLALVVLVSPGIVGHLAERSVNRQADWAVDENRELEITSEGFERGWFASAGQHRVTFAGTPAGQALRGQLGFAPGEDPALIIDTELDHGLVPVASLKRESGSLTPGLGQAVSRLSYEAPDGTVTPLPGVVRTRIGLTGALSSHYTADEGAADALRWGAADLKVDSDAASRRLAVDGTLASLTIGATSRDGGDGALALEGLAVAGDMTKTPYDFYIGDLELSIDTVTNTAGADPLRFGPFRLTSESALEDEAVASRFAMNLRFDDLPDVGDVAWQLRGRLGGLDAAALGRLLDQLEELRDSTDAALVFAAVEGDLKALVAHGLSADIEQFDITLPQGTLAADLEVDVAESELADFVWTAPLLGSAAKANVAIPVPLFDYIVTRNPEARTLVALGFLVPEGDEYTLTAEYRQGLLTVNGAPMPIPIY
ncbi:MAG TPA: DUF945 family protein [Woeseiaceae bacterium]|nr:DUF945 family protein [Woeseiaceae bacterium]